MKILKIVGINPIDAVKFLAYIASEQSLNPDDIDKLINKIVEWLEERTASSKEEFNKKLDQYFIKPVMDVKQAGGYTALKEQFDDWFQIKMHPEYS